METKVFKSSERGLKKLDWLSSNFTFSFSNYYNPANPGFGLLKVFNDDYVMPSKGFGLHAHYNMEIISIMLAGKMSHIDSMGYDETVEKDSVQIMSAGKGLKHKEYNIGNEEVNFLQIWIEPKLQNIEPRYQKRSFPENLRENKLVAAVSHESGQDHCWINQQAKILLGYYTKPQQISYPVGLTNKCVYIFSVSGSMVVSGTPLDERDAIGIWNTQDLNIEINDEARFVLIEVPVNH